MERPRKRPEIKVKSLAMTWIVIGAFFVVITVADMISPYNMTYYQEQQLLDEARDRILKIRRDTVELDFGVGNASKTVQIIQDTHAFKFGANSIFYNRIYNDDWTYNDTLNQKYAEYFSRMFNYATLPFYMKTYNEFNPILASWQQTLHNITDWVKSFNATPKGHPIIWQKPGQIPDQIEFNTNASYREEWTLQHIENLLNNHTDIEIWDLVNEMTHIQNILLGDTAVETWEKALARARSVRPNATFIVNEFDTIQPGDASSTSNDAGRFYDFVEEIIEDGYAPDVLGFQGHEWITGWLPLQDIIDTFDSFGEFKIPCHVTEFDTASKGYYSMDRTTRRGLATDETQAECAATVYTMLFSHPAIEAITWWSFYWDQAWQPERGLYMMDKDGRILPIYDTLFDLIHVQWNSSTTITLDDQGKCGFTGFYGNYTAKIENSSTSFSIVDNRTVNERPWTIGDVG
ncbi:MAG: endo-1,4-beta-xylanase [Candidatus Hodarchaeota archaeon]